MIVCCACVASLVIWVCTVAVREPCGAGAQPGDGLVVAPRERLLAFFLETVELLVVQLRVPALGAATLGLA